MKNYLLPLFFLTIGIGCHGQPPQKNNQLEQNKQKDENIFIKRASKVIIKFNDALFVKLAVTVFSKDSVIVQSIFVNNSPKGFYLYKPLLSADGLLKESVFGLSINDKTQIHSRIKFTDYSEGKYYEGSRQYNPSVIPESKPENFLFLQPNDSMKFIINIANFYDLKPAIAAGFRHFSIDYIANMPLVTSDFVQVFEKEKRKKAEAKPVFIAIAMHKANEGDNYFSGVTHFTIK